MPFDENSKLGDVLDSPKARAVIEKYMPEIKTVSPAMLALARPMTLKQVSAFPQAKLPEETMDKIMAELAKI